MNFFFPWSRSNIRLTGRFPVQWLNGFERIEGRGEELSADEIVVTFPEMPPPSAIRIFLEVNGTRLCAKVKPQRIDIIEKGAKQFRCTCRFGFMGPGARKELSEVLEGAPSPPYRKERFEPPRRSPIFRRKRAQSTNVIVPPEIEAKIVAFLAWQKRLAAPSGVKRPLLAIKSAHPLTEDGKEGMQYRVRSRIVDTHGVTKTFDTAIFIPHGGEPQTLEYIP